MSSVLDCTGTSTLNNGPHLIPEFGASSWGVGGRGTKPRQPLPGVGISKSDYSGPSAF